MEQNIIYADWLPLIRDTECARMTNTKQKQRYIAFYALSRVFMYNWLFFFFFISFFVLDTWKCIIHRAIGVALINGFLWYLDLLKSVVRKQIVADEEAGDGYSYIRIIYMQI